MKPSAKQIEAQKKKLRKFIEGDNDQLERRLAQVAEDTLRWATEHAVGWKKPVDELTAMAEIIRRDSEAHNSSNSPASNV